MIRYFIIYWRMTLASVQNNLASRSGAAILILGKVLRFGFFLSFLFVIGTKTKIIAGYTLEQMIFFFLTFQLIDTIPQFFMREVYRFRGYIVSGDFDYILLKPISPLFRSLLGGTDPLDIPMIFLSIGGLLLTAAHMNVSFYAVFLYVLLIINALIIAVSFHIFVLALGIITTEVDHAIMLYRDLTQMGRFPVDIYQEPLRSIVTFVIPIGIMMTVPAQAIMGLVSMQLILASTGISGCLLLLSSLVWAKALKLYASASS